MTDGPPEPDRQAADGTLISWASEREGRTILHIALPLAAAYVAEMGMVITDMIIVGRLGSKELAAVGLAGDLFWIFLLIGMGVISVVGVIAAQNLGAGRRSGVIAAGEQGMWVATFTSLPIMAGVWFMAPLLALARQDAEVVSLIEGYSRVLAGAVLPALWFLALRNYVTALARSAAIGWITFGAVGLNLLLNWALVYGRLGLPALGVVGAGIGTTAVNWIMFAVLAAYVRRARALSGHRPRVFPRRPDGALLREMFSLGLPVALTQILNGGMYSTAAVLIGVLGAASLAAQQIVYSVVYLALSAAAALGDAVRVRVAFALGQEDARAAGRSARIAFQLALVATLLGSLLLWLAPELLARAFLDTTKPDNAEVLGIAVSLSGLAGLFLLLNGTQSVCADALRGLRDTRSPLWVSLLGYWLVGLGAGALLCFALDLGAQGIWWGLVTGMLLCNFLLITLFRRRLRETARRLAGQALPPG
ncbi:MAG: MATE family efflux transporter [Halieaceae bacterium]|jgi:MATE family multidrug resistance protein|nr:MATE family efflux transporter [Halieaceae bacterium]